MLFRSLQGALKREASIEQELIDGIATEKSYYEIKEEFNSTKAALQDINEQMNEAATIYQQLVLMKKKVAELESNLEIANLDNQFLKEELDKLRPNHS